MEVITGSNVGHFETSQWISKECRACLYKPEQINDSFNLFETWPQSCPKMGQTLASDLEKLCSIQIENGDGLSDILCKLCVEHLNNALTFISQVKSTDKILRNRLLNAEKSNWPKPIQIDKKLNEFAPEHVEIKEEALSEDEMNFDEYNNMSFGEIKIEPEEIVMPIVDNADVNGFQEHFQEELTNGVTDDNSSATIKIEPNSEEEESTSVDVPLDCLLCAKSYKCLSGLKAHVIAMHSYKGVKRKSSNSSSPVKNVAQHACNICRRTFATPTDLMVHETCHNKSVCYSCNKSFDTFQQLTKHRPRCKAAKAEVSKPKTLEDALRHQEETQTNDENFKCGQCNEQFSDIFYLQVHLEIHNSDAIEFNVKFESENDAEESKNKIDSAKDDLEKMLQADVTTDSLETLLQSNNATNVMSTYENKTVCYDQANIETDIVKESLQQLLQSDDSVDSICDNNKQSKVLNFLSDTKKDGSESKIGKGSQRNKQIMDENESKMKLETDKVNKSLQELFKADSDNFNQIIPNNDTDPLEKILISNNDIENNEQFNSNHNILTQVQETNTNKIKVESSDSNISKLEDKHNEGLAEVSHINV